VNTARGSCSDCSNFEDLVAAMKQSLFTSTFKLI